MATSKSVTVLMNNVSVAAGGLEQSTTLDLQDGYGAALAIKITNGATGPTVAASAQIWASPDNSNFYKFGGALQSTLGNNIVTSWIVPIPMAIKYLYVIVTGNTGQAVTARVSGTEVGLARCRGIIFLRKILKALVYQLPVQKYGSPLTNPEHT